MQAWAIPSHELAWGSAQDAFMKFTKIPSGTTVFGVKDAPAAQVLRIEDLGQR